MVPQASDELNEPPIGIVCADLPISRQQYKSPCESLGHQHAIEWILVQKRQPLQGYHRLTREYKLSKSCLGKIRDDLLDGR